MAPEQLLDLLPKVAAAVAETAAFIRHERKHFSPSDIELKSFNDLVSYVDREAEERLTAACTALMPGSGFIREEGDDLRSEADYRWIIDPLDGTTNFIHDIPAYCISLALQYREETILGIVHDVPRDEVFSAVKRKGAWKNGEPMQVSIAKELGRGLIA
ncbi:MAG: inositol monophosphatase family protein, partial [Bacteroidota bacterium]